MADIIDLFSRKKSAKATEDTSPQKELPPCEGGGDTCDGGFTYVAPEDVVGVLLRAIEEIRSGMIDPDMIYIAMRQRIDPNLDEFSQDIGYPYYYVGPRSRIESIGLLSQHSYYRSRNITFGGPELPLPPVPPEPEAPTPFKKRERA